MFENLSNVEISVIKNAIKNDAKVIAHFMAQNDKLEEKIKALQQQQAELDGKIKFYDEHTRALTGGYSPLDLCKKVARGSQMDWVLKYPDTIIPVSTPSVSEPVDNVSQETVKDTTPGCTESNKKEEEIEEELNSCICQESEAETDTDDTDNYLNENAQPFNSDPFLEQDEQENNQESVEDNNDFFEVGKNDW